MKKLIIGSVFAVLLSLAAITWVNSDRRMAAERFLADLRQIRAGESTLSDIQTLEVKYRKYSRPGMAACSPEECDILFVFDNKMVSRFYLARPTVLSCRLRVDSAKVSWIQVIMASTPVAKAIVQQFPRGPGIPAFVVGGKLIPGPNPRSLLTDIRLTPDASPSQIERAFAFNTACMTRYGGCEYSDQMLPEIRQNP